MQASLTTLLSVIIGGAITFLASYILEARKLKNEKYKFTRDKIISVGEEFYRFSGYALLRLETLLDNYETLSSYNTQEARNILQQTDQNLQQLLAKIAENNITITTADIFYGVSGVEKATAMIQSFKAAHARLEELIAEGSSQPEILQALETANEVTRNYINLIKNDRLVIKNRIVSMLEINSSKLLE